MALSSADPNAFLAVGMQTALGTPQVTAAKLRYAQYLSGTDVAASVEVVDMREGMDGLDWGYTYKKMQKAVGQIVINARPELAVALAAGAIGMGTWDGASAPAAHTYHTSHASFPWFTVAAQHPGSTLPQLLTDVLFTGLTIEGQAGEPEKWTIPFIAIGHGASFAALTPTTFDEDPFVYHYSPTYVLDGNQATTMLSYKIEIGLGIEELQSWRVTLDDIAVQNRDINFEATLRYVDATRWKAINMGGGIAPTTSVATGSFRTDHLYGAAAGLRSLQHQLPLLSYRGLTLTELDPDGKTVIETVSAKALKGATHTMFSVVKSGHASAYS